MFEQRLQRIREQVAYLAALDPTYQEHGATRHRYQFHAPLTDAQIERFETRFAIRLPADFRAFVQTLGNGGAGPNYGIFTLGEAIEEVAGPDRQPPADWFTRPFVPPPLWDDSDEAWMEEVEGRFVPGVLPLCDQGCGHTLLLVVSGPEYGTMWHGPEWYNPLPDPAAPRWATAGTVQNQHQAWVDWVAALRAPANTYRADFLTCYEQWVTRAVQRHQTQRAG